MIRYECLHDTTRRFRASPDMIARACGDYTRAAPGDAAAMPPPPARWVRAAVRRAGAGKCAATCSGSVLRNAVWGSLSGKAPIAAINEKPRDGRHGAFQGAKLRCSIDKSVYLLASGGAVNIMTASDQTVN